MGFSIAEKRSLPNSIRSWTSQTIYYYYYDNRWHFSASFIVRYPHIVEQIIYIFQSLRCLPIKGFGRNRFLVISPLALLTYISDRRSLKWRGAFGYGRITSQRDVHWLCGGHGRLPLWSVLSNQGFQGPSMNGNPICNKKRRVLATLSIEMPVV